MERKVTKYGSKSQQEQLAQCAGVKYPRAIPKHTKPKKRTVSAIAEIILIEKRP